MGYTKCESTYGIPKKLVDAVKRDVVPLIQEGIRDFLNNEKKHPKYCKGDALCFGWLGWRFIYDIIPYKLNKQDWDVRTNKNDLKIRYLKLDKPITLRIHRCDEITRIPKGGNSLKHEACSLLLPGEVESYVWARAAYAITYNLDPVNGLGRVTIGAYTGVTPQNVIAKSVVEVYKPASFFDDFVQPEETLQDIREVSKEPKLGFDQSKKKAKKKLTDKKNE